MNINIDFTFVSALPAQQMPISDNRLFRTGQPCCTTPTTSLLRRPRSLFSCKF